MSPCGAEGVIQENSHRLSLNDRLPSRSFLIVFDVVGAGAFVILVIARRRSLHPLFDGEGLVLEGMRQFVREYGLLLFRVNPVEQSLRFSFSGRSSPRPARGAWRPEKPEDRKFAGSSQIF